MRADVRAPGVWDDYHVTDGRLVSGMNPQSAHSTAEAAVEAFEKLLLLWWAGIEDSIVNFS
jgi:putative intracellular protease/amidase